MGSGASRKECHVVRNGTAVVKHFADGCMKLEDLTCGANPQRLEAIILNAEPEASCWEARERVEQRWYYILEGKLEVFVNESSHMLSEGDSLYLKSADSHIWRNPTSRRARALVVTAVV